MQWLRARMRMVRYVNVYKTIGVFLIVGMCAALIPTRGWACACGCGVFEVNTPSILPNGPGGTVWLEYDYMDQYLNWHATEIASANKNDDKRLQTNFLTLGGQYMFNHDWGAMVEVPYTLRYFRTTDDETGDIVSNFHSNFGDVRLWGMYTGFSEDMSTGLQLGVKTPSGDWTYPNFDRDTEIGSGSTDLLLGGYHRGEVPYLQFQERPFSWFSQLSYDWPLFSQDHYRPGREFDGSIGVYYNFGTVGILKELAPMLTFIGSDRTRDHGSAADPQDSGYDRVLVAPGGEIKLGVIRIYGDVEIPIFQNITGNQVTAPVLFKTIFSYDF